MHILSLLEPPPPHERQLLSPHLVDLLHHWLAVRLLHPDLDQPRHRGQPLAERLHPLLDGGLRGRIVPAEGEVVGGRADVLPQNTGTNIGLDRGRRVLNTKSLNTILLLQGVSEIKAIHFW